MSHTCEAALVICEDFRLHQRKDGRNYVAEFIKKLGMDCDLITRGGGVQDIVRPPENNFDKSVFRDVGVSARLHAVHTIILLNHEDCGAYGSMEFGDREEELEQHKKDLKSAREILLKEFPGKAVKMFLAELEPGSKDVFVTKEI